MLSPLAEVIRKYLRFLGGHGVVGGKGGGGKTQIRSPYTGLKINTKYIVVILIS